MAGAGRFTFLPKTRSKQKEATTMKMVDVTVRKWLIFGCGFFRTFATTNPRMPSSVNRQAMRTEKKNWCELDKSLYAKKTKIWLTNNRSGEGAWPWAARSTFDFGDEFSFVCGFYDEHRLVLWEGFVFESSGTISFSFGSIAIAVIGVVVPGRKSFRIDTGHPKNGFKN